MILLSLVVSASIGWTNFRNDREINGPFDPVCSDMFEYLREQTPPDSIIIFFRPRVLRSRPGAIRS